MDDSNVIGAFGEEDATQLASLSVGQLQIWDHSGGRPDDSRNCKEAETYDHFAIAGQRVSADFDWICDNLPKVRDKPKIFKAFQKYARMNEKVAERAIKHGMSPNIDWRYMPADNGAFLKKYPTSVFISQTICEKFRDANSTDRSGMSTLIELTILHELVHSGNSLDGKEDFTAKWERLSKRRHTVKISARRGQRLHNSFVCPRRLRRPAI